MKINVNLSRHFSSCQCLKMFLMDRIQGFVKPFQVIGRFLGQFGDDFSLEKKARHQ